MKEVEFIGEHLLPGQIGNFLITFSFALSLLSAYSYFRSEQVTNEEDSSVWKKLGRIGFLGHGLSVLGIIGIILYIMSQKYYEYDYVFSHVSDNLPMRFILSAFWEGQEGSFLLWMFWHVILGFILLKTAKKWEGRVMFSMAAIQAVLGTMLLGIVINWGTGFVKIGINPLLLTRDVYDFPFLSSADYLSLIQGSGLNPLLQNYWMTIHPPTLFLGFALCSVPFAYAVGALWKNDYKSFLKEVLPWGLITGAMLGAGIIMGAIWAYEALNFGGYWAWDPVENMSLVPWLILIAGIHTNLIAKSTGYSVKSTVLFYIIAFLLVLYSTFLTRSGVLGESSVHAFTQMGLEWQLVFLLAIFLIPSLILYFKRSKVKIAPDKEEAGYSREFWMFIGALILAFSAIIITFSTSIPVYNKVLDGLAWITGGDYSSLHRTVPIDPIAHYNKNQIWIGILTGVLTGVAIFLRYNERNWSLVKNKVFAQVGISVLMAGLFVFLSKDELGITAWQYALLAFSSFFVIVTNVYYLITLARKNIRLVGSVFSHVGFGLLILGALASGLRKHHISTNPFAMSGLVGDITDEELEKFIFLLKDQPMFMSGYMVTYETDTLDRNFKKYDINFNRIDSSGNILETFKTHPVIVYDNDFSKVAAVNPSTKRYINKDIFTTIASLPPELMDIENMQKKEDTLNYKQHLLNVGDEYVIGDNILTLEEVQNKDLDHHEYTYQEGDTQIAMHIRVRNAERKVDKVVRPAMVFRSGMIHHYPVEVHEVGMKLMVNEMSLTKVILPDNEINYEPITIGRDEKIQWNGYEISLLYYNAEPTNKDYNQEEGDIALEAVLQIEDSQGTKDTIYPVFIVRDEQLLHTREVAGKSDIVAKFINIDTRNDKCHFMFGLNDNSIKPFVLDVAENFDRADYIVLEAVVFPWMSLVWAGCLFLVLGLLFAFFSRVTEKNKQKSRS